MVTERRTGVEVMRAFTRVTEANPELVRCGGRGARAASFKDSIAGCYVRTAVLLHRSGSGKFGLLDQGSGGEPLTELIS